MGAPERPLRIERPVHRERRRVAITPCEELTEAQADKLVQRRSGSQRRAKFGGKFVMDGSVFETIVNDQVINIA